MNSALRLLSTRSSLNRFGIPMTPAVTLPCYEGWTRERLVERLMQLEGALHTETPDVAVSVRSDTSPLTSTGQDKDKVPKTFDFSKHPRRKIALKFCYSGWEYSGLAHQIGPTPLPTVENVLFDAMVKAHLVDPATGLDGCGWERCGRTDRGVSAAGQVVSLWIRSQNSSLFANAKVDERNIVTDENSQPYDALTPETNTSSPGQTMKPQKEIDYLTILNRLLPDTIRVIAWSPVSNSFSARFSCKYRHYKYFFSSLHLDISRMEAAAAQLLGEHDFRNLCKLDVQRQLTNFKRTILRASITPLADEMDETNDRVYVFDLVGTAFLYHQVRHIMATLFLVGSGFEHPKIIAELMNVEEGAEPTHESGEVYTVVGSKPDYQMADDLPLMLWECGYDESELDWRTCELDERKGGDLHHQVQSIYTRSRIRAGLDQHFLRAVEVHHPPPRMPVPSEDRVDKHARENVINVPLGGGIFKRLQKYKPLLERNRLDVVEVMNERWRLGKGSRRIEKRRQTESEFEDGVRARALILLQVCVSLVLYILPLLI